MKPIALTMGEPSGIAPEITVRAWQARNTHALKPFFVIGDKDLYRDVPVQSIDRPEQAASVFSGALPVLHCPLMHEAVYGSPDPQNARPVLESIRMAVEFCLKGQASAVVTNSVHKGVLQKSGLFPFPGHTEYLAHLEGKKNKPVMMLAARDLKVVPLTIHAALKDVPGMITRDLIVETAVIVHNALNVNFGLEHPRIAICGLNPHAGEDGAFGREEIDIIRPAADWLRSEGVDVTGPLSADTMFHEEARRGYDAALCMYHDQALIPLKTLDFHGGVNITLGLAFVRTSPDHGTALAIAGQGKARADSLIHALQQAPVLSKI